MDHISISVVLCLFFLQHTRFVQECKDAEPDVLFVGDSMIQLMQQYEVRLDIYLSTLGHVTAHVAAASSFCLTLNLRVFFNV